MVFFALLWVLKVKATSSKLKTQKAAAAKAIAQEENHAKFEQAHALALEMGAQRIRATHHYNKLIHGFDKKSNLRETWRAWKPVDQVHIPEWRQIGLNISKSITGIIGSIRKLTTEYFDIYGLEVKRDALNLDYVVETGGSVSDGVQSVIDSEPDDIMKIGDPLFSEKCIYAFHSTNEKYEQSILHPTFLFD